jgi:hypothetical protein
MESLDDPFTAMRDPLRSGLTTAASALVAASVSGATQDRRAKVLSTFRSFLFEAGLRESFSVADVCNFLAKKFDSSTNISSFEEARTAIATTLAMNTGTNISDSIIIRRMAMGAKICRPRSSKYEEMWDLNLLFDLLRKDFWADRPLLRLRARANILVRISIAGRNKDVSHIERASVEWSPDSVSFRLFKWKTQRTEGTEVSRRFVIRKLGDNDAQICPYRALWDYWVAFEIERCRTQDKGIWFGYRKRTSCVKHATLSKDCKEIMRMAGIPNIFSSGTIRHATITWWRSLGVPMEVVMSRTGHRSIQLVLFYYDKSSVSNDITADLLGDESSSDEDDF